MKTTEKTANVSIELRNCPLQHSIEDVNITKDAIEFTEYTDYSKHGAKRILPKAEAHLFHLFLALGKDAIPVFTHAAETKSAFNLPYFAKSRALKGETKVKGNSFFDVKETLTPDQWKHLVNESKAFNNEIPIGSIANYLVNDGTFKVKDIVAVHTPQFETIFGIIVWTRKGALITVLTSESDSGYFSITNDAKVRVMKHSELPKESVEKLTQLYDKVLEQVDEMKQKEQVRAEKRAKKEAEELYQATEMKALYDNLVLTLLGGEKTNEKGKKEQVKGVANYTELKAWRKSSMEVKLTKALRTELTAKSKELGKKFSEKIELETIEAIGKAKVKSDLDAIGSKIKENPTNDESGKKIYLALKEAYAKINPKKAKKDEQKVEQPTEAITEAPKAQKATKVVANAKK